MWRCVKGAGDEDEVGGWRRGHNEQQLLRKRDAEEGRKAVPQKKRNHGDGEIERRKMRYVP